MSDDILRRHRLEVEELLTMSPEVLHTQVHSNQHALIEMALMKNQAEQVSPPNFAPSF